MKVIIDVSNLNNPNLTGVGIYAKNLIGALTRLPDIQCWGSYKFSRLKDIRFIKKHTHLPLLPYFPYFTDKFPPDCDVFHGPDFRVPPSPKLRRIVTIHDIVTYEQGLVSEDFIREGNAELVKTLRVYKPDHIITVSDFTKNHFLQHFPEFEGRVTRVYSGIDHLTTTDFSTEKIYDFPFLLSVGTLERRKNFLNLIKAFEKISPEFPDLRLVLVGGKGFDAENILQAIQDSSVQAKIIRAGYVSEENLIQLYRQASVLVYPSLFEGFGLPILEAMRLGCPVITSDFGAMQEIGSSAALLCNTKNTDDLASAISEMLKNQSSRTDFIKKGLTRAATFTWQTCAEKTVEVYKTVINS